MNNYGEITVILVLLKSITVYENLMLKHKETIPFYRHIKDAKKLVVYTQKTSIAYWRASFKLMVSGGCFDNLSRTVFFKTMLKTDESIFSNLEKGNPKQEPVVA